MLACASVCVTSVVVASPPAAAGVAFLTPLEDAIAADQVPAIVEGRFVERRPAPDSNQWIVTIEVDAVIKGQAGERIVATNPRDRCGGRGDSPPDSGPTPYIVGVNQVSNVPYISNHSVDQTAS